MSPPAPQAFGPGPRSRLCDVAVRRRKRRPGGSLWLCEVLRRSQRLRLGLREVASGCCRGHVQPPASGVEAWLATSRVWLPQAAAWLVTVAFGLLQARVQPRWSLGLACANRVQLLQAARHMAGGGWGPCAKSVSAAGRRACALHPARRFASWASSLALRQVTILLASRAPSSSRCGQGTQLFAER